MRKFLSFAKPCPPGWAVSLCGITGAALLLSAAVCFFAYNWAALGLGLKFGLPLLGLLVCAWGAWTKGLAGGAGQVCSFACGIFIGVFWAVYGQAFQTGSFEYEFFAVWAACVLPLAVLSGNRWLWLLEFALFSGYIGEYGPGSRLQECLELALALLFFAAFEAVWFKTKRMGWFSVFFLLPALGVCLEWMCARAGLWTPAGFGLALGIGAYAYWAWRGAVQLGLCALALDIGLCIQFAEWRAGRWLLPFFVLGLTIVSAWGVYVLTRKGEHNG